MIFTCKRVFFLIGWNCNCVRVLKILFHLNYLIVLCLTFFIFQISYKKLVFFNFLYFFGYFLPDIAPVIEGAVQHIASRRFEIGGVDLTKLLAEELGKSNPTVNLSISDVERLKEQYSCCAEDELAYEKIQRSCQREQHTLPDGQVGILAF